MNQDNQATIVAPGSSNENPLTAIGRTLAHAVDNSSLSDDLSHKVQIVMCRLKMCSAMKAEDNLSSIRSK